MSLFRRGQAVPDDVLARAGLARGERVLAHDATSDGTALLGTRDALVLVPPGDATTTRIPWEQVETADWDRDTGVLRVVGVGEFGRVRPVHELSVEAPGRLLQLVRERVTASVVLQRRVVVTASAGLQVVARRPPRGTGAITWAYDLDPGVDPDDPAVREAARLGLLAALEELGLEEDAI